MDGLATALDEITLVLFTTLAPRALWRTPSWRCR